MNAYVALMLAAALLIMPGHRARTSLQITAQPRRQAAVLATVAAILALCLLPPPVVVASALTAGTIGLRWHRHRRNVRETDALTAVEAGLEVIVGELRVGAHPVHAFSVVAAELGGPVGESFGCIAARARLGVGVNPAALGEQDAAVHWRQIGQAWNLAEMHGLAVADLLEACRLDLVEHQRFTARVNAGLAGPRATAAVLTALPVIGLVLGQLIGAHPLSVLCSDGLGGTLLVAGALFACMGLLWSDRIVGKALR